MNAWLEFFRLPNVLPIVTLICLLNFVASRFGEETVIARRFAQALGLGTFFLYSACWFEMAKPAIPPDYVIMVTQALFAMGVSHGIGRMIGSVIGFIYVQVISRPLDHFRHIKMERRREEALKQQEKETRKKEEAKKAELEEAKRRRREEEARRPPPPTSDDLLAEAKERYHCRIRFLEAADLDQVELRSAKAEAKRKYLREIDGLI